MVSFLPGRPALLRSAIVVVAVGAALSSLNCFGQYHDLDPALTAAAKAYDQAQIDGDRAALERLVADDYLILRGNGSLGDKKVLLEVVAGEGLKNNPYTVEKPFQRIYGNTVILGGWVHLTGTDHGKPYTQDARFADTWTRRSGRWQVVFTSVAAAATP